MGRLLCVWEQGGSLGHLSHLRLPAELALARGHTVYLAVRELQQVRAVMGDLPVRYLVVPHKPLLGPLPDQQQFLSYSHLLDRQCFSSSEELQLYLLCWRSLFDLVQPDLVLFEHSPTALVAAHAYGFGKINVGTGFTVPPPGPSAPSHASASPQPFLPFPTTALTPQIQAALLHADAVLLARINQALQAVAAPPLTDLHALFDQVHARFLMTWPELDQFAARADAHYLGVEPPLSRALPQWPEGPGPKVFAYLEDFACLEALLRDLQAAQLCCLLYVRQLPEALRRGHASASLRFVDEAMDLPTVARQAQWVISHAGHSTAAFFARQGLPQLLIPRYQEQLFTALRLVAQGAAAMAYQDQSAYSAAIAAMANHTSLRTQARQRAQRLQSHGQPDLRGVWQNALQRWLGSAAPGAAPQP